MSSRSIKRFKKQKQEKESAAKKAYANSIQEIENLTQHLQNLSSTNTNTSTTPPAPNNNAIQICLKALKEEHNKLVRDERLRLKFSSVDVNVNVNAVRTDDDHDDGAGMLVCELQREESDRISHNSNSNRMNTSIIQAQANNTAAIDEAEEEDASWEDVDKLHDCYDGEEEEEEQDNINIAICKKLAEETITLMAQSKVTVYSSSSISSSMQSSSLTAQCIALALHGAMVSPTLAFICTGNMPMKSKLAASSSSGFAAPIRDLSRNTFIPKDWNKKCTHASSDNNESVVIALRYRKEGMDNVGLKITAFNSTYTANVDCSEIQKMQVQLLPMTADQDQNKCELLENCKLPAPFEFDVNLYLNLTSLEAAAASSSNVNGAVMPALHYKNLSGLMGAFLRHFDSALGQINYHDEEDGTAVHASGSAADDGTKQFVDQYMKHLPATTSTTTTRVPQTMVYDTNFGVPRKNDLYQGDFAGDVVPNITGHPSNSNHPLLHGGNLMGPNHPAFMKYQQSKSKNLNSDDDEGNSGGAGLPRFGGLGMQPRFDPYGPPGGPTMDPDRNPDHDPLRVLSGRDRGRGGRLPKPPKGDPNPDHMKPPNDLSHMYM